MIGKIQISILLAAFVICSGMVPSLPSLVNKAQPTNKKVINIRKDVTNKTKKPGKRSTVMTNHKALGDIDPAKWRTSTNTSRLKDITISTNYAYPIVGGYMKRRFTGPKTYMFRIYFNDGTTYSNNYEPFSRESFGVIFEEGNRRITFPYSQIKKIEETWR